MEIWELQWVRREEFEENNVRCSGCYEEMGDLDPKTPIFFTNSGKGDLFWHLDCAKTFCTRMIARLLEVKGIEKIS